MPKRHFAPLNGQSTKKGTFDEKRYNREKISGDSHPGVRACPPQKGVTRRYESIMALTPSGLSSLKEAGALGRTIPVRLAITADGEAVGFMLGDKKKPRGTEGVRDLLGIGKETTAPNSYEFFGLLLLFKLHGTASAIDINRALKGGNQAQNRCVWLSVGIFWTVPA
ncbi:MAG: hypothetical protein LBU32_22135 [Clostridiales bacterium]|jgi:hypothetical protein|nr:hypothetical protein [Clostridiales bacterium]